jgi:hypothetical protein
MNDNSLSMVRYFRCEAPLLNKGILALASKSIFLSLNFCWFLKKIRFGWYHWAAAASPWDPQADRFSAHSSTCLLHSVWQSEIPDSCSHKLERMEAHKTFWKNRRWIRSVDSSNGLWQILSALRENSPFITWARGSSRTQQNAFSQET